MEGVLNETTETVHKHRIGPADLASQCGATDTLAHDNLRMVPVRVVDASSDVEKCGRCFEDGGGY